MKEIDKLSFDIIGAAIQVHQQLGPGLLEKVYELALLKELELRGLRSENQVYKTIDYKGQAIPKAYCIDILVEGKVIVEIKSVEEINRIHFKQTLSYLRVTDLATGFDHKLQLKHIEGRYQANCKQILIPCS